MAGDSSDGRFSRTLKHAVGMAAAAGAFKGLQLAWKQVTGQEPPLGPDDEAPLGRAIIWTLVMGAAITTARMIAIRYAAILFPRGWRQRLEGQAPQDQAEGPDDVV